MSWHYLQEREAESWEGNSLDGAPFALLKLMPTAAACCSPDSATECSNDSQFGTTFGHSTERAGADTLTLLAAGSRAKTLAAQGKAQDLTESAADSGWKWRESFVKYDPASRSWKTRQCSLLGDLDEFSETWPRWGLMRDGECSERQISMPRTSATESGLLPTLTVISCEHPGRVKRKGTQQTCISMELSKRDKWEVGGKYSPSHAAWFMGWPESWTNLGRLAMDKYHAWLQAHGGF